MKRRVITPFCIGCAPAIALSTEAADVKVQATDEEKQ
jgi:hypothetical protein